MSFEWLWGTWIRCIVHPACIKWFGMYTPAVSIVGLLLCTYGILEELEVLKISSLSSVKKIVAVAYCRLLATLCELRYAAKTSEEHED